MSAATLFDPDRLGRRLNDKRDALLSMLTGGYGANEDLPEITAPPRPVKAPAEKTRQGTRDEGTQDGAADGSLSRGHYLRGLEEMIQRTERAEVDRTLGSVSPREVQAIVQKAAKAKARYLAAVLDVGDHDTLPDTADARTLEAARERHEALDAGVRALLAELREGNVKIKGVQDEADGDEAIA